MLRDKYNLQRFIKAQDLTFSIALKELQEGKKCSHWMWYIFPQLKHLGHSYNAKFYGISGLEEATAYLEVPVLTLRLRKVSETILNLSTNNPIEVFGGIDSLKLCSSMTLFDIILPNDIFAHVLDKYFNGQRDNCTIKIIKQSNNETYI